MRKYRNFISLQAFLMICCVMVFVMTLQGCEPLRKKFLRSKKAEAPLQAYEPILDPIDYPQKVADPKADYAYRFSLFQVWQKELLAGLDDRISVKRLQYFLRHVLIQLQEMARLLPEQRQQALTKAIARFQAIQQTLAQPPQFYNLRDVKISVLNAGRVILNDYRPSEVENEIKSWTP